VPGLANAAIAPWNCAARTDAAARHNAVQMRMQMQVLTPRVEDSEKPHRRAQTFGIGRDGKQCFRSCTEQDRVDLADILQCQRADLLGSVNTTWKYGTGSRSASLAAIHFARAMPWHFGQCGSGTSCMR